VAYRDGLSSDAGDLDAHGEAGLPGAVGVVVCPLVVVGPFQGQPAAADLDRDSGDGYPALHFGSMNVWEGGKQAFAYHLRKEEGSVFYKAEICLPR